MSDFKDNFAYDFPVRQEITVLPADPGPHVLNWCIYEEMGCEVFRAVDKWAAIFKDLMPDGHITEALEKRYTIRGLKDIKAGDSIVVGHFFGWEEVKVREIDYDKAEGMAESDVILYPLEYTERRGWVNSGMINKACLSSLTTQIEADLTHLGSGI